MIISMPSLMAVIRRVPVAGGRRATRMFTSFFFLTAQSGAVTKLDESLWGTLVDFMTVYSKDDISVTFKDGTEIHIG